MENSEACLKLTIKDLETIKTNLQNLYNDGYKSIAVCLAHSYTFPDHELAIGKIAKEVGFPHVSLSSQLLPMIKMTPRGQSTTADAYLTPILRDYLDGFYSGFEGGKDGSLHVEFMGSDGGLVDLKVSVPWDMLNVRINVAQEFLWSQINIIWSSWWRRWMRLDQLGQRRKDSDYRVSRGQYTAPSSLKHVNLAKVSFTVST